ncbi:MAG: replicative DNA helicase [Corynebacterium sp.]|nr:replicative DNA helicase [Corynebacterium sp.]
MTQPESYAAEPPSFEDDYLPAPAEPREEMRGLPRDLEAERSVLGAMLLSHEVVADVMEILSPQDFFEVRHERIFTAITTVFGENSETVEATTVAHELERNKQFEAIGGYNYLYELSSSVATASNAMFYAKVVIQKSLLRQIIKAGESIARIGYDGAGRDDIDFLIDKAQQEVYGISKKQKSTDYLDLDQVLELTFERLHSLSAGTDEEQSRVLTGFHELDELTTGLQPGQMIIIAARPGVGKSTLALDFVRNAAFKHNKTCLIFSLEMSAEELGMRMISAEGEIRLADLRSGSLDEEVWSRMARLTSYMETANVYIDDSSGSLTMLELATKARRLKQSDAGLDLLVLDYLQLLSSGGQKESRQQEVSEFSRQMKLLAKELEIPVIAISQLNRGPESRNDKRPQLADLRESGSLEQDADIVLLLNRPDSQDKDNERAGEADIIIAKHRGGPIDTIEVAHQLHYSRFVNMPRG